MSYIGRRLTSISRYLEDAVRLYEPGLGSEEVDIMEALGRYLAQDVEAVLDVPPCDKPVLDGYAVRYHDVMRASPSSPVILRLLGPGSPVDRGAASPVEMKDCMPPGADTVVPLEWCREVQGSLMVYRAPRPGYAVARRGEDVRRGELLLPTGTRLDESHIALLASQGLREVVVWRPLRAAVLCVGDELLEPGEEWRPGMVYNSTCRLVAARLRRVGVEVAYIRTLGDDADALLREYEALLGRGIDVVISCGGTGPGKGDVAASTLRLVAERHGLRYWHGFSMRPGRAAAVAVGERVLAATLSGLPLSAWSQLYMLVEPLILNAYHSNWPLHPRLVLPVLKPVSSTPGLTELYYARLTSNGLDPIERRGAGKASVLARADAVIIIGEDEVSKKPGDPVEAHLLHAIR